MKKFLNISAFVLICSFANLPLINTVFAQDDSKVESAAVLNSCSYTDHLIVASSTIDFTKNLVVKYFNPALGTLTSLTLTHSATVNIQQKVENLANGQINFRGVVDATTIFSFLSHNSSLHATDTLGPVTIPTYDGTDDLGGTSFYDNGLHTYNLVDSPTVITNPTELANFVNAGNGGVSATESLSTTGATYVVLTNDQDVIGPYDHKPTVSASANIEVVYNYTSANPCGELPPPPVDVCPNIAGNQATVPDGMHLNSDGQCVPNVVVPACSDLVDNDGDNLIDQADPGCHSDGNPNNSDSYLPQDNDETNTQTPPGGGGGGRRGGSRPTTGEVLGASTECGIYLDKFLQIGRQNNPESVKKLQVFLNQEEGANLVVDGIFGVQTDKYSRIFQEKHADKVLKPWGLPSATGIVYLTTTTEINNIMCPPLNLPIPTLVPMSQNVDFPAPNAIVSIR